MTPCRNGGHLQSCKNFECNMKFKCAESYCIPWTYVCDGKWDCPEGDDELENPACGRNVNCIHMYRCRKTNNTCLHIGNVCDGINNCPLEDDKLFCDLKDVQVFFELSVLIVCHFMS